MFVMDASVALTWCFSDEATAASDAILRRLSDESATVPAIWPYEVANVLTSAARRGRISEAQISRFVALLSQLSIDVDDAMPNIGEMATAARHQALTSYDVSYLLLAERLGLPLATLDRPLAVAARSAGVPLLIGT